MPIVLPAITGALTGNMAATGNIGQQAPQLASGIASGLTQWVPTIVLQTTDTGSLGVGNGVPVPLVVAQPLLYANLLAGAAKVGLVGIFLPALMLGIANGMVISFLAMLLNTQHPGIGVGAGVVLFRAPPAVGAMLAGFASAGMVGDGAAKMATAVGFGLDVTFASLVLPIAIAGSASPAGGASVGVGNII